LTLLEWIVGLADGLPDDATYVPDRLVWRAQAPTGHRVELVPFPDLDPPVIAVVGIR
jgi:hypothetical protein